MVKKTPGANLKNDQVLKSIQASWPSGPDRTTDKKPPRCRGSMILAPGVFFKKIPRLSVLVLRTTPLFVCVNGP